ncbi:MAG: hypothetical protein ABI999_15825 [Acidobacteriota bacterium]
MLKVSKSLGAILISMALGAIIGAVIASMTLEPYTGGGALPAPNTFQTFQILYGGFCGAIEGFLSAIITVALVKSGFFPNLEAWQIFVLTITFGLINSLLWTAFAYSVAVEGGRVLHDYSEKMILETAVKKLITGCIVGGISVLLVKFFSTSSTAKNQSLE